jgi:hypothetical protein
MSVSTQVYMKWDYGAIEVMLNSRGGKVNKHVEAKARKAQEIARSLVGKRTGRLAASISMQRSRTATGFEFTIGSMRTYALLHHTGTRPHVIVATPPKLLRFRGSNGVIVHKRAVMHPGTRPNPYLTTALRIAMKT